MLHKRTVNNLTNIRIIPSRLRFSLKSKWSRGTYICEVYVLYVKFKMYILVEGILGLICNLIISTLLSKTV